MRKGTRPHFRTGHGAGISAGTIFLIAIICLFISSFIMAYILRPPDDHHYQEHPEIKPLFRVEKNETWGWDIIVYQGSKSIDGLNLVIEDRTNNTILVNASLSVGVTADFMYYNNGDPRKFDALDEIVLRATSPNIRSGYWVRIMKDGDLIAGPQQLP